MSIGDFATIDSGEVLLDFRSVSKVADCSQGVFLKDAQHHCTDWPFETRNYSKAAPSTPECLPPNELYSHENKTTKYAGGDVGMI